jgi:NTE family protein
MNLIPPKKICLSGGGIRAVSFVGALEVLQEKGLLKAVTEYIGVSAGAFLEFALCIGYTIAELKLLCLEFDFTLIRDIDPESALAFFDTYGFDSGDKMVRLLESLLRQKGHSTEFTFEDLRALGGPTLRCYATDLTVCNPREFSVAVSPKVRVVDALRASMGLTFFYTPVKDPDTGHLLTDGAVSQNYPMSLLSHEEQKHSLGMTFSNEHLQNVQIEDIGQYIHQIFACVYIRRSEPPLNTIVLPNGNYPSWKFEASREDRLFLMKSAADAVRLWCNDKHGPCIERRYSV